MVLNVQIMISNLKLFISSRRVNRLENHNSRVFLPFCYIAVSAIALPFHQLTSLLNISQHNEGCSCLLSRLLQFQAVPIL